VGRVLVRSAAGSAAAAALAAAAWWLGGTTPHTRILRLPAGVTEVHSEILVEGPVVVEGQGAILRAAPDFHGRALLVASGSGVKLSGFAIEGRREILETCASEGDLLMPAHFGAPHTGRIIPNGATFAFRPEG